MSTSTPTLSEVAIAARFTALAKTWKAERGPQLSITRMSMHPAYQRIIGMGDAAVPLILRELESSPDHWFWALNAITGVDPIPVSSRGVIPEMIKAWLEWEAQHGYR